MHFCHMWLIHFITCWQNYLRNQPDNLRSFDLVSDVAQYLNVLCSNITGKTIDLLSLVYETLNELCQVSF